MKKSPKKNPTPPKKASAKTSPRKKSLFAPEIKIYSTAEILFQETAHLFMQTARAAVSERGKFITALSGGSTPRGLFQQLAEEPYVSLVPWDKTYVFWVDERHVPLADP